ncbi:MAG TPA: glutamate racemase [Candidatus Polarisedimenticolaceae bacterium]|nr:glutamate racemase [Candidatus Polarisedimenticolaceae bacterium]
MTNRDDAIGVFDSGIGGLTVLQKLIEMLPTENTVYLGDTARAPYGTKSIETVVRYSFENTEFLIEKGVKLVVVACNTSTALALEALREKVNVPLIGVIEPGVRKALLLTKNKKVGVIGTEATIQSGAYTKILKTHAADIEVYSRACPMFVPLVEEGWIDNGVASLTVEVYLGSLKQSGIDTLILGCTHYPLLKKAIRNYMGSAVQLVDSAEEIAREVGMALEKQSLARRDGTGNHSFFVTDAADRFIKVGGRFLGEKVESAVRIER